jgi:hypothetical protein
MIDALTKTFQVAIGLVVAILVLGLVPGDGMDFNVTGSLVLIVIGLGLLLAAEGFRRGHARGRAAAVRAVQGRTGERIK